MSVVYIPAEADSMEEDDSMLDSDDGWEPTGDGAESRKRLADADGGDGTDAERPYKRRRYVSNEAAIRVPLSLGWKRETLIRSIGKSGVRGEVHPSNPIEFTSILLMDWITLHSTCLIRLAISLLPVSLF